MPRFSVLQAIGILTIFAISFGLWQTSSFDVVIAIVVALAGTSIMLLRSRRRQVNLIVRSMGSIAVGLMAAFLYAATWSDELKHVQIGIAVAAAIVCWAVLSLFAPR